MAPKTEYFIADHILEAVHKTQCHYHYGHTNGGSRNGQTYYKSGKSFLLVKGNSARYKR
jgi:hypothetical protein